MLSAEAQEFIKPVVNKYELTILRLHAILTDSKNILGGIQQEAINEVEEILNHIYVSIEKQKTDKDNIENLMVKATQDNILAGIREEKEYVERFMPNK